MNEILRRIVDDTVRDLERVSEAEREAISRAAAMSPAGEHRFIRALKEPGIRIIAEIKAASPSAGTIRERIEALEIAQMYARGGAAALSIVTEPHHFGGSRDWLTEARPAGLPSVMKDFVVDPMQIDRGFLAGADAVLLLASVLDQERLRELRERIEALGLDALVEVHDERELESALESGASIIGVNNRDLRSFEVDLATAERLGEIIPQDVVRVSESGIQSPAEVERLVAAGYRCFLVGESLMRAENPGDLLGQLTSVPGVPA